MMMVGRSCWASVVLLGALACGGEASHGARPNGGGVGGNADGESGPAGTGGSAANASGGGKPNNGGSSASTGSAAAGSGGTDGSGSGTGSQAGSGAGSAGHPGVCFGPDIDVPSVILSGKIKLVDSPAGNYGSVLLTHGADVVTLAPTDSDTYSIRIVPGTYDLAFKGVQNGLRLFKTGVSVPSSGPAVLDIDVPFATVMAAEPGTVPDPSAVTLIGKLTIDGQVLPVIKSLILSVRKLGTDNWADFASMTSAGYSGPIAPGTYDVKALNPGATPILPGWGYDHIVSMGLVVPDIDPARLDIDVRTATVSGALTFNGGTLPNGCSASLRSAEAGSVSFGSNADGAFSARVLPGTYDVVYGSRESRTSPCPLNTSSVVKRGLVVPAEGLTIPTIDIPSVGVSGKLTLGGAALSNPDDDGTLSLRTDEGDEITLAKLSSGTFSTRVIPGTYDLYFDVTFQEVATLAPRNRRGKIKRVLLPQGEPIALDIDVPSTVITGTVKVNGSFLDENGGRLWLGDPKGNAGTPFAWTSAGKYSARVLPGMYELFYQATSPSALAPLNASARLGCFVVQ